MPTATHCVSTPDTPPCCGTISCFVRRKLSVLIPLIRMRRINIFLERWCQRGLKGKKESYCVKACKPLHNLLCVSRTSKLMSICSDDSCGSVKTFCEWYFKTHFNVLVVGKRLLQWVTSRLLCLFKSPWIPSSLFRRLLSWYTVFCMVYME